MIKNSSYELNYELYGIIVHRGDAYKGHYFSYIRDLTDSGLWDLDKVNKTSKKDDVNENDGKQKEKIEDEVIKPIEKSNEEKNVNEDANTTENNNDLLNKDQNNEINKNDNKKNNKNQQKNNKEEKQNNKGNKNQNNNNNKGNKKNNNVNSKNKKEDAEDESHLGTNFDNKDFPIPYENANIGKNWFCFDDTNVFPITVGRLQKQFKSKESAYMLLYIRKDVKIPDINPQEYFMQKIIEENNNLLNYNEMYKIEENNIITSLYNEDNFEFNSDGILCFKSKLDDIIIEDVKSKLENEFDSFGSTFKINLEEKLENLVKEFKNVKEIYSVTYSVTKITSKKDKMDKDIRYNKDVRILSRINFLENSNKKIKELSISHNSNLIIVTEKSHDVFHNSLNKYFYEKSTSSNIVEPIYTRVIYKNHEVTIQRYSNEDYISFKLFLIKYFKISFLEEIKNEIEENKEKNSDEKIAEQIAIYFDSGNKKICMDDICLSSKKDKYLNVSQLKINERILYIKSKDNSNNQNSNSNTLNKEDTNFLISDNSNIINILLQEEDDENVISFSFSLKSSFLELKSYIRTLLSIHKDIEFRIRKKYDGRIIFLEDMNNLLEQDPVFVEDGVRLQIEKGENYLKNEFLIKIYVEDKLGNVFPENIICYEESKLDSFKKHINEIYKLESIHLYRFFKTNWLNEPVKEIKTDTLSLKTLKIKEGECLYFKNKNSDSSRSYVKFYIENDLYYSLFPNLKVSNEKKDLIDEETIMKDMSEQEKNDYKIAIAISDEVNNIDKEKNKEIVEFTEKIEKLDYVFKSVKDNLYRFCLDFDKESKIIDIKKALFEKLMESDIQIIKDSLKLENIRLRVLSNKMEITNILQNTSTIRSLNLHSPICLYLEYLDEKEPVFNSKKIELFLFERNSKDRTYINRKKIEFEWTNQPSSKELYEFIGKTVSNDKILLLKYFKSEYRWVKIGLDEENLKKGYYNLRDGNYIAWVPTSNLIIDDFQTNEDSQMTKYFKVNQTEAESGTGSRQIEKNIRLKLDD